MCVERDRKRDGNSWRNTNVSQDDVALVSSTAQLSLISRHTDETVCILKQRDRPEEAE